MTVPTHPRWPVLRFEAVRELVGILRALYATERQKDNQCRLLKIQRIALELRAAIDLAMECEERTLGTRGGADAGRKGDVTAL